VDSAAYTVVLLIVLGAVGLYVSAIVVCFRKGKPGFGWLGIAGVFVPFLGWFPIVGAFRLAKPTSPWAQSRYGSEQMTLAAIRFPDEAARQQAEYPTQVPDLRPMPTPASTRTAKTVTMVAGVAGAVILAAGAIVFAALAIGSERDSTGEIVQAGHIDAVDVTNGDCINIPERDSVMTLEAIPCAQPHDAEVYDLYAMAGSSYPGEVAVEDIAAERCLRGFDPFVGLAYEDSELDVFWLQPTEDSWKDIDDREIACLVVALDGSKLTGSMRGSGR